MTTHGPSDHERPRVRRMTPSDNEYQRMTTNDHEQHRVRTNKANVGFTLFQAFSFSTATNSFSCCTGLRPTLDSWFLLHRSAASNVGSTVLPQRAAKSNVASTVLLQRGTASNVGFTVLLPRGTESNVGFTVLLQHGAASNVGFTVFASPRRCFQRWIHGFAAARRCLQRWIHGFCFSAALRPTLDPWFLLHRGAESNVGSAALRDYALRARRAELQVPRCYSGPLGYILTAEP